VRHSGYPNISLQFLRGILEYLIFDSEQATTPADGPEGMKEILGKQRDLCSRERFLWSKHP